MDNTPTDATPLATGCRPGCRRRIALFWLGFILVDLVEGLLVALRTLLIALLVSLFLSFAIEPAVNALARRGWRRGAATGLVFLVILLDRERVRVRDRFGRRQPGAQLRRRGARPTSIASRTGSTTRSTPTSTSTTSPTSSTTPTGPARGFVEDLAGNALKAGRHRGLGDLPDLHDRVVHVLHGRRRTAAPAHDLFGAPPPTPGGRARRRGSSRSRRPAAISTRVSSSRCCRPCSTGSRSRSSAFRTRSRSRCGSGSSRSSSPSSARTSPARSRCSSRCSNDPVRRRRDPDLRARVPAGRELHLRPARHRADARATSGGRVRDGDRGRGGARPGRRAARAPRGRGHPGVHLDARRAPRGRRVRAHGRAAAQAPPALVPADQPDDLDASPADPTPTPTHSAGATPSSSCRAWSRRPCPASSAAIRPASFLPSSTPHWSNESMPQIAPSVSTLCSYAAISAPSVAGFEAIGEEHRRRPVAGHEPVRLDGFGAGAERERFGLREQVAEQQPLVTRQLEARLAVHEPDEVDRHECVPLVQELEVRVLAVRAGRAPHDLAGRHGHRRAVWSTDLPLLSISSCWR